MAAGGTSLPIGCERGGRKGPQCPGRAPAPALPRGAVRGAGPGSPDAAPRGPRGPPSAAVRAPAVEGAEVEVISVSLEWEACEGQSGARKGKWAAFSFTLNSLELGLLL